MHADVYTSVVVDVSILPVEAGGDTEIGPGGTLSVLYHYN